jgi:hypothetical protein
MVPVGSTCAAAGPRRRAATLAVMPTTRRRPKGKGGALWTGGAARGLGGGARTRETLAPRISSFFSGERRWCAAGLVGGCVWEAVVKTRGGVR